MADIRKLTEDLSVAPQITADDLASVGERFKSILYNRPDHEVQISLSIPLYKKLPDSRGLRLNSSRLMAAQLAMMMLMILHSTSPVCLNPSLPTADQAPVVRFYGR